jgi:hypothetical protein
VRHDEERFAAVAVPTRYQQVAKGILRYALDAGPTLQEFLLKEVDQPIDGSFVARRAFEFDQLA